MKMSTATIEIKRQETHLESVSVIMPTWSKLNEEHFIDVSIPMLGLKTIATSSLDIEKAIHEALKAFCIVSEQLGKGIESELQFLGWTLSKEEENKTILEFTIETSNVFIENILETGHQFAEQDMLLAVA